MDEKDMCTRMYVCKIYIKFIIMNITNAFLNSL